MLRVKVDRHKCIAAGNCITIAPTAFDWLAGDFAKVALVEPTSVEEELLRDAVLSCPTLAIELEEV
ncbi:MAG TPA: ferredoxin, partial [Actinomycetota bacterium]|nr:ferredoxin [Actinomycetota bacterium]